MPMTTKSTNPRYETLSAALAIIDPDGLLAPGTAEHNRVTETILSWMHVMDHAEVLRKSANVQWHFQRRWRVWQ